MNVDADTYRYGAITEFVDPNDPELSFTPDMLRALDHLPESPTTDAEWGEWFDFFTTYPQSFVSKIECVMSTVVSARKSS